MKGLLTRLKGALGRPAPSRSEEAGQGERVLVNAYCTRADVPALEFPHALQGRRDLSDPELAPTWPASSATC